MRVVIALGITWILDGLEVTIVGAIGSVLEEPETLGLTSSQVGYSGSMYIAGAILGSLLFGHLADVYGRKKLFLVTLALYVAATLATACSVGFWSFAICRFVTGMGIGGEYSAINSAIDELIPARVRGVVDLAINGSYWIGTAFGAVLSSILLDPAVLGHAWGFRAAFALGAALSFAIMLVRRFVPESPRWLMVRGRVHEAERIVADIETHCAQYDPSEEPTSIRVKLGQHLGLREVAHVILTQYRERAILGLALMTAQAFFYNAIFFTYSLTLTKFYAVRPEHVGRYLLPFAAGNFMGPMVLGRLFDTWGRRQMIVTTYALSGVCLLITGGLFQQRLLTSTTHTLMWSVSFFFASAAASSAYLTVSELFPLELRGLAIALFYAVGTGAGGLLAPALFGVLIESQSRVALCLGYTLGASLMIAAAGVAYKLGVAAEGRGLESLAPPLSTAERSSQPPDNT